MRLIGQLKSEANARTFGDYLYAEGIRNQIEPESEGIWAVWIHAEEQIERAHQLLLEYNSNPNAGKFRGATSTARELAGREEAGQKALSKRWHAPDGIFLRLRVGPLSVLLITVSIAVGFLSGWGGDLRFLAPLFISERPGVDLPEVRAGQLWRLFTPMFIHFGPVHLLFNMLWLKDLGTMIETRLDTTRLFALVLTIAACSDVAQYVAGGPLFGGMSGVVYGLFGYIWIRGRFQPECGLYIDRYNVMLMIVWFLLCLGGWVRNAANTAHAAGLALGMAWGYAASRRQSA